ncbi:DnaB-like helicase C-terminal domain-containing protein [Paenibacillus vini]|uniref:replicative DNA helicase n=1 Tax=Paenibacillus vini TaxID=1476024 RepID=UPI0025B69EE8|nr:DnaB-like helicase C-terminal domain-containing protein [Paenibacillus vini]MDN4069242.1 DnaB-like helicase C-terminal domain-containing protein [Paenibacillus vini]MDN4069295.1 DnaB-like helicase C-terminal domain-containing protein [Paenibacillus vini]
MEISTASNARETHPSEELLGLFLKDPTLLQANYHLLTADLFQEYYWLFELMLEVESVEGLTFKGVAQRLDINQIKLLQEMKNAAFNENRVPLLIRQLKKERLAKGLSGLSREVIQRTADGEDPDQILRDVQNSAFTLESSESGGNHEAGEGIDGWFERKLKIMEDNSLAYGLLTGIGSLDALTTGWHRKDFSVVGGWTSMGKTAFVLEIVKLLNAANYKCAIFSLEMIEDQIYDRMTSNILQVSLEQFRLGKLARHHYLERANRVKEHLRSIFIDDTRGISADYITDVMRRLKRTQGLDFVVVDYIQDVKETGEMNDNGGSALARVCRKLRAAAKEMDCHVMGLSQITRGVNDRQDKRPLVSDLAGSTGIETSADVIALLYRDDYYNKDSDKKGIMEVNFAKQRNGGLGVVELNYDRTTQSIREIKAY